MVRIVEAPADSLAAIRAFQRLGMAIAAIIKMIATTMSNSIRENPFSLRIGDLLERPTPNVGKYQTLCALTLVICTSIAILILWGKLD